MHGRAEQQNVGAAGETEPIHTGAVTEPPRRPARSRGEAAKQQPQRDSRWFAVSFADVDRIRGTVPDHAPSTLAVWSVLIREATVRRELEFNLTDRIVADRAAVSPRLVQYARQRLKAAGLLTWRAGRFNPKTATNEPTRYTLKPAVFLAGKTDSTAEAQDTPGGVALNAAPVPQPMRDRVASVAPNLLPTLIESSVVRKNETTEETLEENRASSGVPGGTGSAPAHPPDQKEKAEVDPVRQRAIESNRQVAGRKPRTW